jgi:hypothetical protein
MNSPAKCHVWQKWSGLSRSEPLFGNKLSKMRLPLILLLTVLLMPCQVRAADGHTRSPSTAHGRPHRSSAARRAFRRANPCPATSATTGPCLGDVIDHVEPLACGGLDDPSNMQWQTTEAAKEKDKTERRNCVA